jgi:hypothetical protein
MSTKRKILLGISVGLAASLLALWYFYPRYLSPMAREGAAYGYHPPTYVAVKTLQLKAEARRRLSDSEMTRLNDLACNNNPYIAAKALSALWYVGGTGQEERAAQIARDKLSSKHPLVRLYALSTLARLKAPDAMQIARQMFNDPDVNVRQKAERLLAKGQ